MLNILRKKATSALVWFHAGTFTWPNWNFSGGIVFWREENRKNKRKTLAARQELTTNLTYIYDTRLESNPGHIGAR